MGADLYMKKLHKGNYHCYEGMSSVKRGYFRDSYNRTNLLWQFGMSYWAILDQYKFNRAGEMKIRSIRKLKRELERVYAKKDWNDLGERFHFKSGKEKDSKEKWIEYFKQSYKELMVFLNIAIENKYTIRWSV